MKQVLLLLLLTATVLLHSDKANAQGELPPVMYDSTGMNLIFYDNIDSLLPGDKDTIQVFMIYVDTTMSKGTKTIKVNGVYKLFTYYLPVDPKTYWKKGFAVLLKKDASAMALPNDHTGEFEYVGFIQYLDEIKQPFAKKYLVMYTKAFGYDYNLPPVPEETQARGF